jgi:hypothetical protein
LSILLSDQKNLPQKYNHPLGVVVIYYWQLLLLLLLLLFVVWFPVPLPG